jgi:hypothetical protein
MITNKTKNYDLLVLADFKEDLGIYDSTYDRRLKRYIKDAVTIAENFINEDIVPTTCSQELTSYWTPFAFLEHRINQRNITITGITVYDYAGTPTTITDYKVERNSNSTNIVFRSTITGHRFVINYTSGFTSIPTGIHSAISMKVRELMDGVEAKKFESILSPYCII